MSHLVKHLREAITRRKILSDDLQGIAEILPAKHGGYLARIFQTQGLSLSPEASELFKQAALTLETKLKNITLNVNEQTLTNLVDPIIQSFLKTLKEDPEWGKLLSEIKNEKNRSAFERDVSTAFMFKIITDFVVKNQHLKRQAEYIRIAANTLGQSTEERLKKLLEKIPAKTAAPSNTKTTAKAQKLFGSGTKDTSAPAEEKMVQPILYYYFGKGSSKLHGHVAIEVPDAKYRSLDRYLSYGKGSGTVGDTLTYPEDEARLYGNKIARIVLPARPLKDVLRAKKQFEDLTKEGFWTGYWFLFKNCAHAVINFMKTAGYVPSNEIFIDPRPASIAKRALEIVMADIKKARKEIAAENLDPLKKITRLIDNDIERLKQQIWLDDVSHYDLIKDKVAKEKKIKSLGYLTQLIATYDEDYPGKVEALIKASETVGKSKTAKNLRECLDYFPFEKLPQADIERKRLFLIAMEASVKNYLPKNEAPLISLAPDSLSLIKKLFPENAGTETALTNFSARDIYLLFDEIFKKLAQENQKTASLEDIELQNFYKAWYLKAGFTRGNVKLRPVSAPSKKEEENVVDINLSQNSSPSFLKQPGLGHLPNPQLTLPGTVTKPTLWYSIKDKPNSVYQYIKKNEQTGKNKPLQLLKTLRQSLTKPLGESSGTSLNFPPKLEKDELRLSTHVLSEAESSNGSLEENAVKFGLYEKCIRPGQELNSKLILPKKLTQIQLLRMIDLQIQEGSKLLGEPGKNKPSITVRSLKLDDILNNRRKLKRSERTLIQYSLAMDFPCIAMNNGKKSSIPKDQLETLVPDFDREALRQKILDSRQPEPEQRQSMHN